MNKKTFGMIKLAIQVVSVFFSFIINILLIYLIVTKSPKVMGTYRHLMIYFCCCSIIFSIVDVTVQPNILTYKSAFFMIIDVKSRGMNPLVAEIFMHMLCGCFGVTIYGIAIHFVYRYFALERKIVNQSLGFEVEDSVYAGAVYFPINETGTQIIHWRSFIGFAVYLSIMFLAFTVIIFAGSKSGFIVRDLLEQGESEYSKNLQLQLYKALVAQTIVPVSLLFMPFGFLFTLPIFEINCQFLAKIITLIFAFYPAIDPLPIIYFIDYYRIPVSDVFKNSQCNGNRVYVTRDTTLEN